MKRCCSILVAGILALLLVPHFLSVQALSQSDIQSQSIVPALNYLARNYNSTLGLLHESPDSANLSNTYWLYSDNFLASLAFKWAGKNNASLSLLSENLTRSITYFVHGQSSPANQYQVFTSSLPLPFNALKDFTFGKLGIAIVKSTVNNQTGTLDPEKYADVAFLEAIASHNNGRDSEAFQFFLTGQRLWNGTGFKDDAFTSVFATYKIALYIYAARLLGQTPDSLMVNGLLALQSHDSMDSGGFFTTYTGKFQPISGTNTETTALAIIALSEPDAVPRFLIALVVLGFSSVLIAADWARQRGARPEKVRVSP